MSSLLCYCSSTLGALPRASTLKNRDLSMYTYLMLCEARAETFFLARVTHLLSMATTVTSYRSRVERRHDSQTKSLARSTNILAEAHCVLFVYPCYLVSEVLRKPHAWLKTSPPLSKGVGRARASTIPSNVSRVEPLDLSSPNCTHSIEFARFNDDDQSQA